MILGVGFGVHRLNRFGLAAGYAGNEGWREVVRKLGKQSRGRKAENGTVFLTILEVGPSRFRSEGGRASGGLAAINNTATTFCRFGRQVFDRSYCATIGRLISTFMRSFPSDHFTECTAARRLRA